MNKSTSLLIIVFVMVAVLVPSVYAFEQEFSPTAHAHSLTELSSYACAGEDNSGEPQYTQDVIRVMTTMRWDETHAQTVRDYARNEQYYTHDITDMDNYLNGWCLWTNFPNAYYDWDNDSFGENSTNEESEVAAIDTAFLSPNMDYSVNFYFSRWYLYCNPQTPTPDCRYLRSNSGGTINITPQISEWSPIDREYNVVPNQFDRDPIEEPYEAIAQNNLQVNEDNVPVLPRDIRGSKSRTVASISFGPDELYTAEIAATDKKVFVEELDVSLTDHSERTQYQKWARALSQELQQNNVAYVVTTVTFNQHITPEDFVSLAKDYQIDIDAVRVEYTGVNVKGKSEVWSGFIRNLPSTNFATLDKAAQDATIPNGVSLELSQSHGVTAVYATIPTEKVELLNQDDRVFLADPISGYINLISRQNVDVQAALGEVTETQQVPQSSEENVQSNNEFTKTISHTGPNVEMTMRDLWPFINH
ncbi:MAG: hypothetical protein AAGF95_31735 [Chloroflexota bacterium]